MYFVTQGYSLCKHNIVIKLRIQHRYYSFYYSSAVRWPHNVVCYMFFSGADFKLGSHVAFSWCAPRSSLMWRDPRLFSVFYDGDSVEEYRARCYVNRTFLLLDLSEDSGQHFQPEHFMEWSLTCFHASDPESQYPSDLVSDVDFDHRARCCPGSPECMSWFSPLQLTSSLRADTFRPCK